MWGVPIRGFSTMMLHQPCGEGSRVKQLLSNLKWPAIISLIVVLPFVILEWNNRRNFHEGFPLPLFAILWLLPMTFILILRPIVRDLRAGKSILASPINRVLRVFLMILIAWLWVGILQDQMPCFLGVPNCD
jgi:hypothetical protein